MDETEALLEAVESYTRPCGKVILTDHLVVVDLDPTDKQSANELTFHITPHARA